MLIAPCSVKTLAGIATGYSDELIVRAADVCLKERRRLVLLFRETPLHAGHIESDGAGHAQRRDRDAAGAGVLSPPASVDDIVTQTVGRALDLFGIDVGVKRWKDDGARPLVDGAGKRTAVVRGRHCFHPSPTARLCPFEQSVGMRSIRLERARVT
jgi:4-hydroxy-3-polyprenylbenzoate decarboxylase